MATLSFACLSLAALQAGLLYVQSRLLRSPLNPICLDLIQRMPPLQTMERLLFQVMRLGFMLLSVSLCNAFLYLGDRIHTHPQKIILATATWALFAFLLYRHHRFGFRGRKAIQWTLTGFILLALVFVAARLSFLTTNF